MKAFYFRGRLVLLFTAVQAAYEVARSDFVHVPLFTAVQAAYKAVYACCSIHDLAKETYTTLDHFDKETVYAVHSDRLPRL